MRHNPENFYIRDCMGNIVGNPKGYRTMKGALRQQDMTTSEAYRAIWKAYYAKHGTGYPVQGNLIATVKKGKV